MAKNLLKAWLVDNTVTTDDKTDKIFQLESARNLNQDQILDRMMAKNPGVRRETMDQFRSATHNGAWNPEA